MPLFPKSALPQAAAPHHLSSDGVWTADNSCLHHSRVLHQCILHLCGSNPVPVEEPALQRRLDPTSRQDARSRISQYRDPDYPSHPRNQAHPLELMISSARPMNWKYPSWSLMARSPVSQKSPRMLAAVFSRLSWWPQKDSHCNYKA